MPIRTSMLLLVLVAFCGCAPKRINPPIYFESSARAAELASQLHARDVGGDRYRVADTHSMEPLLQGGDLIVVAKVDFVPAQLVGRPIVYQANWQPVTAPPVTHRALSADAHGLIVSGDNVRHRVDRSTDGRNATSEGQYRVTAGNFKGVVVGIWRVAK